MSYDTTTGELAAVIQTKSPEFRKFRVGDYYDTMLLLIARAGTVNRALTVSYNLNGYSMYGFPGNLL